MIIIFHEGGHKYITTRETLTKGGENFFSSLLSGKFSALIDDKGYYFIDRDGSYFAPILEFLRTGEFFVTGITPICIFLIIQLSPHLLINID